MLLANGAECAQIRAPPWKELAGQKGTRRDELLEHGDVEKRAELPILLCSVAEFDLMHLRVLGEFAVYPVVLLVPNLTKCEGERQE